VKTKVVLTILILILSGCASSLPEGMMSERNYKRLVQRMTQSVNRYSGLYQTFQADATLVTHEMQSALLERKGYFLRWDARQAQEEREKALQQMANETHVVLRFFSPEADYDDLEQTNSVWKVYLESNGVRHEGQARKLREKSAELLTLFPHHNRFSTLYQITFKVPTSAIESSGAKVTLTSTLGTADFNYPSTQTGQVY